MWRAGWATTSPSRAPFSCAFRMPPMRYPGCDFAGPFQRALQAKMSIQFGVAAALQRTAHCRGELPTPRRCRHPAPDLADVAGGGRGLHTALSGDAGRGGACQSRRRVAGHGPARRRGAGYQRRDTRPLPGRGGSPWWDPRVRARSRHASMALSERPMPGGWRRCAPRARQKSRSRAAKRAGRSGASPRRWWTTFCRRWPPVCRSGPSTA